MKRYLLSLLFIVAPNTAWSQSPVQVIAVPQTETVIPVGTTGAVSALTATTAQAATAFGGHCEGGKCSKRDTVCVPVPDKITKTKVLFSSDCEVKCHKGIFSFLSRGDCGSCADGKCGHAHVERYLYKRVQTDTCASFKCVPTQCASGCANGICVGSHAAVSSQLASDSPPVSQSRSNLFSRTVTPTNITPVSAVGPRP
jgi:hypothetical protein